MKKNIPCVVIKPARYNKESALPVVYLLHGYAGRYDDWITRVPGIKAYASLLNLIIVCPDGGYRSWYFNSMIDSNTQYETFITEELVKHIDKNYKTIPRKTSRAITGLSMGGHGALFLALRHPATFGAAGSISGVVDLGIVKNKYEIRKVLGDTILYAAAWQSHSVINMFDSLKTFSQKMIIDCGISDIFISSNRLLHQKLAALKIPHDYIERNGKHDWKYWSNVLPYQLIFFSSYFNNR